MDIKMLRLFRLVRDEDETGISGTGPVCAGVMLPSGRCALEWIVGEQPGSIAIYNNVDAMLQVHGHGGKTRLEWLSIDIEATDHRPRLIKDLLPL